MKVTSSLEREVLGWVGSMFQPSTNEIVRQVKRTNPKAGRLTVSRALRDLQARGMVIDIGDSANAWTLP